MRLKGADKGEADAVGRKFRLVIMLGPKKAGCDVRIGAREGDLPGAALEHGEIARVDQENRGRFARTAAAQKRRAGFQRSGKHVLGRRPIDAFATVMFSIASLICVHLDRIGRASERMNFEDWQIDHAIAPTAGLSKGKSRESAAVGRERLVVGEGVTRRHVVRIENVVIIGEFLHAAGGPTNRIDILRMQTRERRFVGRECQQRSIPRPGREAGIGEWDWNRNVTAAIGVHLMELKGSIWPDAHVGDLRVQGTGGPEQNEPKKCEAAC